MTKPHGKHHHQYGYEKGAFIFPPQLRPFQDAMAITASETFTSHQCPVQYAGITAFISGESIGQYLQHSQGRVLKATGEYVHRRLLDS